MFIGITFFLTVFGILFYGILPRVTLTEGQLWVVIPWGMVPLAAIIGITIGVEEAMIRISDLTPES
jgi:hypothetical protein